jgi:hypothetical protein
MFDGVGPGVRQKPKPFLDLENLLGAICRALPVLNTAILND